VLGLEGVTLGDGIKDLCNPHPVIDHVPDAVFVFFIDRLILVPIDERAAVEIAPDFVRCDLFIASGSRQLGLEVEREHVAG
jgi:hypothetical protein